MLMKKMDQEIFNAMLKKIITIAAFVAIAAGCAKVAVISSPADIEEETEEIPEVAVEPSSVVFTAGIDTKAYLDEGVVKWSGNESITIWNGTVAAEFTTTDKGSSATFSTTGEFTETGTYTALYPHDGGANFSDLNALATTIPASQVATAGSFDPAANLAVASSTTTDLTFYNLVSYLKFTVPSGMTDLTSVSFSGNNSEKVAGAATVNVSTKALSATGSGTATLTGTFAEGSTYYLAIAPQEFTAGYTVTITRSSGSYTMVSGKNVTFSRSKARNIGDLWDGEPVYVVEGTGIAATMAMTHVTGTTQHDEVYSFRGALQAGTVQVRSKYENTVVMSGITIPENGNFHMMYNATLSKFKVYSEDILVDFVRGGEGETGASAAPWNMFTAGNSNLDVVNYFGENTGINIAVGASSTHNGTGGNDKNGPSIFIDDDEFLRSVWYDSFELDNASASKDSDPFSITITNLDPSASYDIRLISMRFNATQTARLTQFTVIGDVASDPQTVYQGYARGTWAGYDAYDFRANNICDFESITPDAGGKIVIQVVGKLVGTRASYHVNGFRISKLL